MSMPSSSALVRDDGQQFPAEERSLDAAALLRRVAGPVGREALGQRRSASLEPVDGQLVDELGRLAGTW